MNRRRFLAVCGGCTAATVVGSTAIQPAQANFVYGPDHDASVSESPAAWLYDTVTSFFSSGYDPDEVEDMQAQNLHWEIWDRVDSIRRHNEGFLTETENWIEPENPLSGALETMVWGEIRAATFKGIENGNTQSEIQNEARDAAFDYITVRQKNYLRQWNEFVADMTAMFLAFADDDVEWDHDTDHGAGETNPEFDGPVDMGSHDSGLYVDDVFNAREDDGTSEYAVFVEDYELADGDSEQMYQLHLRYDNYDPTVVDPRDGHGATSSYARDWWVRNPDGGQYEWLPRENEEILRFVGILDALEEVRSSVSDDVSDYVAEIVDAVSSGDLDVIEILGPTELINEFGDSDGLSRIAVEMIGLGLLPPEDIGTQVTVSSPALGGTETGTIFIDWDFSTIQSWEYEYDHGESILNIDEDSIMESAVYYAVFDDDDETEVAIESGDLIDGQYEFDDPPGNLDTIEVDATGELRSFIPEGETVENFGHAILAYVNDDGDYIRQSFGTEDEFTVEDIISDDGQKLDRLTLSGYNQQTRDPAMSLDQAKAQSDNRVTVSDLESDGSGAGFLPSLEGIGAAGVAAVAGIGFIAYKAIQNHPANRLR